MRGGKKTCYNLTKSCCIGRFHSASEWIFVGDRKRPFMKNSFHLHPQLSPVGDNSPKSLVLTWGKCWCGESELTVWASSAWTWRCKKNPVRALKKPGGPERLDVYLYVINVSLDAESDPPSVLTDVNKSQSRGELFHLLLVQSASLTTPASHRQTGWRLASPGRTVRTAVRE